MIYAFPNEKILFASFVVNDHPWLDQKATCLCIVGTETGPELWAKCSFAGFSWSSLSLMVFLESSPGFSWFSLSIMAAPQNLSNVFIVIRN